MPHVIQKDGDKYEVPRMKDWFLAEVAHVGVQGLPARGAENDLGEDKKSRYSVFPQELEGIVRVNGLEDLRHGCNGYQAGDRQGKEPDQHDRPEGPGDLIRASGLNSKKPHGNHCRNQDQDLQAKIFQTRDKQHSFHGRQEGNGRCDDAVTQQQRDSNEREKAGEGELPAGFERFAQDLPQHDLPSLSLVGQAHGKPGIFRGDQDEQCPYNEGKDAKYALLCSWRQGENDGQRIDGARTDVAEHDPHRADDADPEGFLFVMSQDFPFDDDGRSLSPNNEAVKRSRDGP
jgi:hypothetical protein